MHIPECPKGRASSALTFPESNPLNGGGTPHLPIAVKCIVKTRILPIGGFALKVKVHFFVSDGKLDVGCYSYMGHCFMNPTCWRTCLLNSVNG